MFVMIVNNHYSKVELKLIYQSGTAPPFPPSVWPLIRTLTPIPVKPKNVLHNFEHKLFFIFCFQSWSSFQYVLRTVFSITSTLALRPTQPSMQWVAGALSLDIKQPGHEADHSSPPSAKIKECTALYLPPHYVFMAWCLVKKFTQINYHTFLTFRYGAEQFNREERQFILLTRLLGCCHFLWN